MTQDNSAAKNSAMPEHSEARDIATDVSDEMVAFLTRQYLDGVMTGTLENLGHQEMAAEIQTLRHEIPLGAHLVTPRNMHMYTHHGLYVGNNRVIHYAGLADGFKSAPVEETTLEKFCAKQRFWVHPHHNSPFTPEAIVERARSRLYEDKYGVAWNNCEHFVNWCIDNYHMSRQVNNAVAQAANHIPGPGRAAVSAAQAVVRCEGAFRAYFDGKITQEKLFEESAEAVTTTALTLYYGAAAQAAMPYAPVLGFFIGSAIGLVVGGNLQKAGIFVSGDSGNVQVARHRRERIEAACAKNRAIIAKSRAELNRCLDTYFAGRREHFDQAIACIDTALESHDPETFNQGLETIAKIFTGTDIKFGTQAEFDQFMESDEDFKF